MSEEEVENLGLPMYFKVQRFCFKRLGIDPTNEKQVVSSYFWNLFPTVVIFLLVISMIHYTIQNIQDVDEITNALSPCWQCTLSLCKFTVFMVKRKKIVRLINTLLAWNAQGTEVERQLLAKENKKDILFSNIYHIMVFSTGNMVIVKSFLIGFINLFKYGKYQLVVPIKATYPWDVSQNLYCLLSIFWVAVSVHSIVYTSVSVDTLYSWLTFNVIGQFRILRNRLREAALENNGQSNPKSIIKCIEYHLKIIDMINELDQFIGVILFCKFIISTLQVCVLAFQLSRADNVGDMLFHTGFIVSVATQLFLYCRNAQCITDESADVGWHVYESFQWEKVPVSSRKLLLMPMARAQRTTNISGVFFVVDLSLYLWVFRTASSYITLLLTIDEK